MMQRRKGALCGTSSDIFFHAFMSARQCTARTGHEWFAAEDVDEAGIDVL